MSCVSCAHFSVDITTFLHSFEINFIIVCCGVFIVDQIMLKNWVTLVTGGASGLGKATAGRFASKGARVVLCDLDTSNGSEVAADIGNDTLYIPADVRSENDVKSLLAEIKKKFGRLDAIVNCAGISIAFDTYNFKSERAHRLEDFQKVLMANTCGTFNVIRLGVELIAQNEPDSDGLRGTIINTSTSPAFKQCRGEIANLAAGAGIDALTRSLAAEFLPIGIRVVGIAPGMFDTPLTNCLPDDVQDCISEECISHPNRFGASAEFAHLAQRLLQIPHVNGTTINLDGALHLKL